MSSAASAVTTGSTSAGATFTVAREKAPRWLPSEMSSREAANFWRKHTEYSRKAELGKWIPDSIRECLDPVILIMVANFCTQGFPTACTVEEVTDARVRAFLRRSTNLLLHGNNLIKMILKCSIPYFVKYLYNLRSACNLAC